MLQNKNYFQKTSSKKALYIYMHQLQSLGFILLTNLHKTNSFLLSKYIILIKIKASIFHVWQYTNGFQYLHTSLTLLTKPLML